MADQMSPALAEIMQSFAQDNITEQDLHVYSDDEVSTARIPFDVADARPAAAPNMAHLVLRKGQTIKWFQYGSDGGTYPDGLGSQSLGVVTATETDTTLEKGGVLSSGEERAIEGIAVSCVDKFVKFDTTSVNFLNGEAALADADVAAAYTGAIPMADPSSLVVGDAYDSPFMLEDTLAQLVMKHMRVFFKFDRKDATHVADGEQIPCASACSQLRAAGEPHVDNYLKLPTGYRWAREGRGGHNLTVIGVIERALVIPIPLFSLWGQKANGEAVKNPTALGVAIALRMRLIGPRIGPKSNNG